MVFVVCKDSYENSMKHFRGIKTFVTECIPDEDDDNIIWSYQMYIDIMEYDDFTLLGNSFTHIRHNPNNDVMFICENAFLRDKIRNAVLKMNITPHSSIHISPEAKRIYNKEIKGLYSNTYYNQLLGQLSNRLNMLYNNSC